MVDPDSCKREVEATVEFFEEWFIGGNSQSDIERMEKAFANEFEMIGKDGDIADRDSLINGLEDSYNSYEEGSVELTISNFEHLFTLNEHAIIRYEEWKDENGDETGRISSAVLRENPEAPLGLEWIYLHETGIEVS